ncbi:MAG: DUF4145 domain-containing protein [Burkholderiales bacterium]|jgi:hypothetical protein|uniref:DUF4145 domain-containing protein n=1 Tax=Limnobacter sp. TaxID=2003368 RepID=UPI0039629285|nr:DUF4145 domain-containing protein [Burkholderiales bacterium]
MTKSTTIWTACSSCDRDTKHTILFSAEESEYEYRIDRTYQIVECCGCETKSFRKTVSYIEDAYKIDEDEWEVPQDISSYPAVLKGHQALPGIRRAPKLVREIYTQSLDAIKNQSNILAGIGLRATIEAICNERQVTGRSLEARIDKLAKSGFISQNDADRLHAIRFMGNDAAHEIHAAELEGLLVALRVVEHLIISVYILDKDADGVLETLIKTYAQFENLLRTKINVHPKGTELPLFKYLGKDARRFHGYLKSHEAKLIANIASGEFAELSLGKNDTFAGTKEKFQYYVIS